MSFLLTAEYDKILYNRNNSLFIYDLNRKVNEHYYSNLAWHEEMEVKYIVSGSMNINFGTNTIRAEKGDLVIINPFEYHANKLENGETAVYNMFCVNLSRVFNNSLFKENFAKCDFSNVKFTNIIKNDPVTSDYADKLFSSFEKNDTMLSLGLFIAFFSALKKHMINEKNVAVSRDTRSSEIINKAFLYIHTHFDERIKIQDIAKECYVSEPHFCRVFKNITGETPITYINNLKINKAISLMKSSNLAIKQISEAVGFEDYTYFCRCFKKIIGSSPKAYLMGQYNK